MDQLKKISRGVCSGLYDAFAGILDIRRVGGHHPKSIWSPIFQCILLNGGLFGVSILVFDYIVLKWVYFFIQFLFGSQQGVVSSTWLWLEPTLSYTFSAFWVLPLFLLSRVVNTLWFQDIADTAFRGRSQSFRSISIFIADTLFSLLIQILFLIQAVLVDFLPIPIVGKLVSLFHISLLYSLYAFEYKWFNMGWELHRRLHFIEQNWPYFLGFGLPLAIFTYFCPYYFFKGVIFSLVFPFYIISANEANPRNGICDLQIQIFKVVVYLSNKILFFIFQFNFLGNRPKTRRK